MLYAENELTRLLKKKKGEGMLFKNAKLNIGPTFHRLGVF